MATSWHHLETGLGHSSTWFLGSCLLELLLHLYVLYGAGRAVISPMLCPHRAIVKRALVILCQLVLLLATEVFFAIAATSSPTDVKCDCASCGHFLDYFFPYEPYLLTGRCRHFSTFIDLLMSVLIILLHYIAEIKKNIYFKIYLFILAIKIE